RSTLSSAQSQTVPPALNGSFWHATAHHLNDAVAEPEFFHHDADRLQLFQRKLGWTAVPHLRARFLQAPPYLVLGDAEPKSKLLNASPFIMEGLEEFGSSF